MRLGYPAPVVFKTVNMSTHNVHMIFNFFSFLKVSTISILATLNIMVGPVVYEASVPFFIKALKSQLKLLEKAQEWCAANSRDESTIIAGTLTTDMSVRNS